MCRQHTRDFVSTSWNTIIRVAVRDPVGHHVKFGCHVGFGVEIEWLDE